MVTSARKVVKTRDKDLRLSPGRRRSLRGNNKLPSNSSTSSSKSSDNTKTCWVDRNWKLFLTTAHKVCVWDESFCSTVFTSGSQGILAAKRSKDGSILAVADAQIVILHKVDKGQHQSYRLKGAEGNCRLLQYAHDSKSLFFTDSIHNSVQTYSLREDRVNEAAKSHPSAITSFCVSADSNFLLSCSSDPPVIQLHNRSVNNTVDIKPKASSKPVVCCAFHPTRNNIFVLAFADGVLAAYDSTRLIRGDKARSAARKGNLGSGGGEHIHFFRHLHDASISGGAGITGVEFIPGYRARAVSVGEDGRLFIVDFEKKDVLGSWHVGAPATCVSVRQAVGKDAGNNGNDIGWMVAVGTIHGKCFVFDGGGTKICEQTVDVQAGKVLDVEWVSGDVPLPPAAHVSESVASSSKSNAKSPSTSDYPESISSAISLVKPSTQTLASLSEHHLPDDTTSVLSRLPANPPVLPELPNLPNWGEVVENSTASYLNMFSPVKKKIPARAMSVPEKESENLIDLRDPKERAKERADQRSVISAPLLWDEKPTGKVHGPTPASTETSSLGMALLDGQNSSGLSTKSSDSSSTNQVETVIRPPSVNESYHSETKSLGRPTTSTASMVTDPGKLLSDIRNIRGDTDRGNGGRGLALFAPYMPAGSNARRGVLKNYVVSKKANAGDESTLSISNVSSEVQSGSMDMPEDKSVDFDSESMINDEDSIAAEENQNSSIENVFNEDGAEEKAEKNPFSVEAAPEQTSDEEDIWLIQGLDDHNYSSPNLNSKITTPNKGEPLKRKAPVGDEYEIDYAMQSSTKSSDTAKRIPLGSKVSAGTGSTRSPSGSNKSRKLSHPEEEKIGKKTEAMSLSSSLQGMDRTTGAGWEEVINQMTNELKKDIKVMHKDMIRRFEEQKKILNELSQEIMIVRTENEGLRKELFEIMDRNASRTLISGGQGK